MVSAALVCDSLFNEFFNFVLVLFLFLFLFCSSLPKDFNLKITLPGLAEGSQSLKIRLLPG